MFQNRNLGIFTFYIAKKILFEPRGIYENQIMLENVLHKYFGTEYNVALAIYIVQPKHIT